MPRAHGTKRMKKEAMPSKPWPGGYNSGAEPPLIIIETGCTNCQLFLQGRRTLGSVTVLAAVERLRRGQGLWPRVRGLFVLGKSLAWIYATRVVTLRPKGAATCQPRASPWVCDAQYPKSPEGAQQTIIPKRIVHQTQDDGGSRTSETLPGTPSSDDAPPVAHPYALHA